MSDPNTPGAAHPSEPSRPDGPPHTAPAGATGAPPGADYGGPGKRLLARIIDALVVGIPLSLILWLIPGVRLGTFLASAISVLAGVAYFLVLETSQGATFGKQWLGMSVTDEAGSSPISMDQSFRRNWWMLLGVVQGVAVLGALAGLAELIIVIVIAATISSDARNQGWHDKMARTLVPERKAAV